MYYLAALVTALLAIGAWNTSTVPFIRKNAENVGAGYMGWLIDIFTHFFSRS
jgi:hypothetical protein